MNFSMRHPPALPVLFFTEMWERFSYYGMRALLVLYLVHALHYGRSEALHLYAIYTGLVYLTPIFGGYLADKYLGHRQAILIGGITMALGHFAMAFRPLLNLALGLLIIGNGFFKPNAAALLGKFYKEHDPQRDSGFTIFYIGVNLGAFFSPLIAGTLGEKIGWHWGFASAGVGMCLGLIQFIFGQHKLGTEGFPTGKTSLDKKSWMLILSTSFAMIPLVYALLALWKIFVLSWQSLNGLEKGIGSLVLLSLGVAIGGVLKKNSSANPSLSKEEWHRIIAIGIVAFFVIFFWAGFEQAGGTMNLFADKQTDRLFLGYLIPASYFQAINPLLIMTLGPLFAGLWVYLDRSSLSISTPTKMAIGMIILGLGFIVMAVAQQRSDLWGKVGPQWLFFAYFLHTIGELCLSPIGLSLVTKLAPLHLGSLFVGVWFLANAISDYLAGILESLLKIWHLPLYWTLTISSVSAGLVLLLLAPLLKYLMHEKN